MAIILLRKSDVKVWTKETPLGTIKVLYKDKWGQIGCFGKNVGETAEEFLKKSGGLTRVGCLDKTPGCLGFV